MIQIYNTKQLNLYETIMDYQNLMTQNPMLSHYVERKQPLSPIYIEVFKVHNQLSEERYQKLIDFIAYTIYQKKVSTSFLQPLEASLELQAIPIQIAQLGKAQLCTYEIGSKDDSSKNAIIVTENKIIMQQNDANNNVLFYLPPLQDMIEIEKIRTYKNSH